MPPINYRVSTSEAVLALFERDLHRAHAESRLALVQRAARYLFDELAYDPLRFGESRGFRVGSQLELRLAFSAPLHVWFGVHEESKQVFVFRIGLR